MALEVLLEGGQPLSQLVHFGRPLLLHRHWADGLDRLVNAGQLLVMTLVVHFK
jgi:hypothetical protein